MRNFSKCVVTIHTTDTKYVVTIHTTDTKYAVTIQTACKPSRPILKLTPLEYICTMIDIEAIMNET